MATAVGQDGTGWTPANAFVGNGIAYYFKVGYLCANPANMKNAHVRVNQLGTETLCRVYVYAGVGPGATFVAMSSEIDVTQLGDRFNSIAGILQPGQFYTIVVQNKSSGLATQLTTNNGSSLFVDNQNTPATFVYGSPPGVLPAADFTSAGPELEVWIEDGGGIALVNTVFTPNLVAPIRLTPGAAAVALATATPNVITQANPIPAPGQLSLVSAAVSLALGIRPGPGVISVPGLVPTVATQAGATTRLPLVGALSLLGNAPGITVTSTQGSGLTPNAGFTYTGTVAFEQPLTINVTDGRFGVTGPILISFDDFRNGVLGQFMANGSTPVAGVGVYAGGGSFAPIYRRLNRGGVNPAISILDNERAGGTGSGPFGRTGMKIQFGSHTQGCYVFYAEKWYGTWDGRNDEGAGGGYYKMQWLLGDAASYGATDDDLVLQVFTEGANTSAAIASITWLAGVVTVTAVSAFGFAPGYGPTWRVTMGTGHGTSNGQVQQNPVALAGDFTATQTSPTTFTYPLAADPGPVVTKGTFSEPGSVQGMNVPSNNIPTAIGGNSGVGNGVPGPYFFPAGDSNGVSKWDQNGWNSVEAGWVADPTNPLTAPGRGYGAVYNAVNKQAYALNGTSSNYLSNTQPAYNYFSQLQLVGLMQNIGTHTIDRADYFIQIGSNAYKRFMFGDASTLAQCTTLMPCTPVSWSANSVTIIPRKGAFTAPAGNYLYWFDQNNVVQQVGFCPPGFDFYASTTGSDANPGTLAAPWAITAINSKQATYAGKRLGLLPGTYNVSTLMGTFQSPALQINGGSAGTPTYIGSSDANGNYQRGTALFDAKGSTGFFGGGNSNLSTIMGCGVNQGGGGATPANWGNWTLDGLRFTGFSIWAVQVGTYDATGGNAPNVSVLNCEFFGSNASALASGRHTGALECYSYNNLLVDNCNFHDNLSPGNDVSHYAAITAWGGNTSNCNGLTVSRCSFTNTGGCYGIYDFGVISGTEIKYCFFDMTQGLGGPGIQGFGNSGSTGKAGSSFHHNAFVGGSAIDTASQATTEAWASPCAIYNNSVDLAGQAANAVFRVIEASGKSALFSIYNNLVYDNGATSASSYGYCATNTDGCAVLNYNVWGAINNAFSTYPPGAFVGNTNRNFATWKANTSGGADANSVSSSVNPFVSGGPQALGYKVVGGVAYNFGRVGGVATGAACNVGPWDGTGAQVGCNFALFDFYVAPTGVDTNAGTQAAPWSINAINTQRAVYAGKKVGLMPGTYDVSARMTTDAQNGSRDPALDINGGTSIYAPSLIASCDANGNYSPGTAIIIGNGNGVLGGQTASTNAMIGCNNSVANRGNWRVAGIKLSGWSLWGIHIGNSPGAGALITNWSFADCEFTGGSCTTATNASGVNVGPVIIYSSANPVNDPSWGFTNCYFHDTVGGGTSDASHFSCAYQWGIGAGGAITVGTTFAYCTLVNTGGLHGKESGMQGTNVFNCHIDWTTSGGGQNSPCIMGFDGATTAGLTVPSSFHHNVLLCGTQGIDLEAELSNGGWTTQVSVYNNTFVTAGGVGLTQYFRYFEQNAGANLLSFYNNLFLDNGLPPATNYGYMMTNIGAFALLNYNCYGGGNGSQWNTVPAGNHTSAGVVNRTFAAWKTTVNGGADANSINAVAAVTNSGPRALAYNVTGGIALGAGRVGGLSSGAVVNAGGWDGVVARIGSMINGVIN